MKKKFFLNYFSFLKKKKESLTDSKNDVLDKHNVSDNKLEQNMLLNNVNESKLNQLNIEFNTSFTNSVMDVSQKSSYDCEKHLLNKMVVSEKNDSKKNNIVQDSCKLGNNSFLFENSFIKKLRIKLKRTRDYLGLEIKNIFSRHHIDKILFNQLEEKLLLSDFGFETTNIIINNLKSEVVRNRIKKTVEVYDLLKIQLLNILSVVEKPINIASCHLPFVILIVGVNGVGKTTTIGKLAGHYKTLGKSVMLAAGDTFRAAAIEQLQLWGFKSNISVVAQHMHADPAAVVFDAIKSAQAKKIDVLIIDTAGRLHNKINLMNELKKVKRVIKKVDVLAPHEIILIVDACSGQNTVQQTKLFHESLNLTGIVVTKLDGTAKGGVVFSIANQFSIPIYYIGIGEKITDLKVFNSREFIESIF